MTIRIKVGNRYAYIRGMHPALTRKIEKATSYYVAGFMYAPSFQSKPRRWDGKEHLMSFVPKKGYRVPSGMVSDVVEELKESGYKYTVECKYKRNGPKKKIAYGWNPELVLRPYQNEAVEAILGGKRWERGCGLLRMPIRSGKTKTAAGIIYQLGRRTLFIVPSQQLLHQTVESLEETLLVKCGMIGAGHWDVRELTVATVQSLSIHAGKIKKQGKRRIRIPPDEKYEALAKYFDFVIFDESHHLAADNWREVMMGFNCRYKLGLSGTIYFENESEWERGVIWLKACCGNVRYSIEMDTLVKQGYLLRQNIELIKQREPTGYKDWGWGQELVNSLIYENPYRNRRIVKEAIKKVNSGYKVLVISNRHNQLIELNKLLIEADMGHAIIIGGDSKRSRNEKVKAFLDGEIDILMGTVFGEGVDIPEIECVINAEGGQDIKPTIQRMRNMTPADGKKKAIFIDFMDVTNGYFAKHSLSRLSVYREEKAFSIRIVE